ncbi:IS66 family transposase [bacterium]|nr:MAG: IS66 family transposase [bacterium]
MIRLDSEKDPEILRKAARLLAAENDRLATRLAEAVSELARLKGHSSEQLALQISELEADLSRLRAKAFGSTSSEKRKAKDDAADAAQGAADKPKKTGHGPKAQPALNVLDVPHDLDEADKICTSCSGALVEWIGQDEESFEIDVFPRRFVMKRHLRKKLRCACGACVETAPAPVKLCPGSRYSVDFAIEVAVCKYLDHEPLDRQTRIMKREGLCVDSQTLWDQIERLAQLLDPAYKRLHKAVLAEPVVGADETRWRVMGPLAGNDKGSKWWQIWLVQCPFAVWYTVQDNRGNKAGEKLLGGYRGTVMCDGYAVYQSLSDGGATFRLAHCWAHFRRELLACEEAYPELIGEALRLIARLYKIESQCKATADPLAARKAARATYSAPLVDEIQAWMLKAWALAPPGTKLREALAYGGGIWSGLTRFLTDPRAPLDNNASERAARGPVVGRKNHYGSRSLRGTQVAALFYSLLESAKLAGVEPKAYLRAATFAALAGDVVPLPHEWARKDAAS